MSDKFRRLYRDYQTDKDERLVSQRLDKILKDLNAPLCVNCSHCMQQGFLFICLLFQYVEDGKIVGEHGRVYYYRAGHKPMTYLEVPLIPDDCEYYSPLIPRVVLLKFLNSGQLSGEKD